LSKDTKNTVGGPLKLRFKKLTNTAIAPEKAHASDAGFDLFADERIVINGPGLQTIGTGISLEIPEGYFGKIFDRSGISIKTDLIVKAGVIDSDYRGEVRIVLANIGHAPNKLPKGTKIAQIVLLPVPVVELEEIVELTDTERGEGGFGSTDKP
jgi:dUTP pyrophosphatase